MTADGKLVLIYCNFYIPYSCPIMAEKMSLSKDYLKTVFQAWKKLISDPLIRDYVQEVSDSRAGIMDKIDIIYAPHQSCVSASPSQ